MVYGPPDLRLPHIQASLFLPQQVDGGAIFGCGILKDLGDSRQGLAGVLRGRKGQCVEVSCKRSGLNIAGSRPSVIELMRYQMSCKSIINDWLEH
jgi:hypothetical protein